MEEEDDAQSPSRSQSQSTSRSPSTPSSPPPVSVVPPSSEPSPHERNGHVAEPVTVAAPSHHALALALSIQQQRRSSSAAVGGGGGGGGGGREDCWSEGATSTLIDAWEERFLELSRGNLKQKNWQEVADAVTSRDGYTKTPKTDVQCKNRIDTLKKKYKIEKSKISASGSSTTSSWPLFHRLDLLLGPNHKPTGALPPSNTKIPAGIPIRPPARLTQLIPQRHRSSHPALNKARSLPPSVSSKSADSSSDSSDGFPPPPPREANGKRQRQEPEEGEEEEEGRTASLRELTRAILRFGEVYERVESSKLRQAMEMEKQRMEFTRELESQRLEFLMKTQMELSQLKSHDHHHHGSSSSNSRKKRRDDAGGSSNHHHHHDTNNNSSFNYSDNNG
ncbi:hypothetical protein OPV22_026083 [Ensete ventricosum]|uniref:Myb/SANT-like DNA-binding domain-containing protein n=1 Tax=Ensete ventricosum TaxID=4639 RepID=A0AAV8QJ39_ENSVE|nr:hypothetical protein OPV22_026083 [Ensete ventricosum]